MKIELSDQLVKQLEDRVASGEFESVEDAVAEAVALLSIRELAYGDWLRAAAAEGERSADRGEFVSIDPEYFERLKRRIDERAGFGARLRKLVAEGEADLAAGRFVDVDEGYFDRLRDRIRNRARARGESVG